MALGERIKACRQSAGMSQEKVAELLGVSRQAVTKWEVNQTAPNTDNLFKLAEIFGTTVDMLLASENDCKQPPAEQIYYLYKMEEEKKATIKKQAQKRNAWNAFFVALGYFVIYFVGRIVWCDMGESNFVGWIFSVKPTGVHSYLYGWLLSSGLFWYALVISALPSLWGKFKFSVATTVGFIIGIIAGMIFGPHPEGASIGQGHYGWAIWGVIFFLSIIAGIIVERCKKRASGKISNLIT